MLDIEEFQRILVTSRDYFEEPSGDVFIARAPGRLDVMGGIADYSGSLVLELPLSAATFVAIQRQHEPLIEVLSSKERERFSLSLSALDGLDYPATRALLGRTDDLRWAAYVAGALVVLQRERGMRLDRGVRLLIHSAVPRGKGVASSAALEVAAMRAIAFVYDIELEARELGILCQMVENLVVGAPCGVMDQMTSACGEANKLLALLCQPAEITGQVAIPEELELWGIDSGIRHEVGGADYGAVRTGAFMGYRVIADHLGFDVRNGVTGSVTIDDPRWHGYLANIDVREWEQALRHHVPMSMSGEEFLHRYHGITDTVTRVDPSRSYAMRQPTEHPILENARVEQFRRLLDHGAASETDRITLGELMFQSHASYSACGLGSSGTDRLVDLVREHGSASGLYGAKITGGGSGGVVAVLARRGSQSIVSGIAEQYTAATGRRSSVLGGSSSGAAQFGIAHFRAG